jgi:hypothetical protein
MSQTPSRPVRQTGAGAGSATDRSLSRHSPESAARRDARAHRLEAILEELDAIEAWREAVEVSALIERLRARCDDA